MDRELRPPPEVEDGRPEGAAAGTVAQRAAAAGQSAEVLGVAAADAEAGVDAASARLAAEVGMSGEAQDLPHREAIQAAFGRHEVGELAAHQDPQAAAAAELLGVEAFTAGAQVAFAQAPDLAEAAEEAARALWQAEAGPEVQAGQAQAPVEAALIEAVGVRVAEGREVEGLLDRLLAGPEGRGAGFEGELSAFAGGADGYGTEARGAQEAEEVLQGGVAAEPAAAQAPWAARWLGLGGALEALLEPVGARGLPGRRRRTGAGWLYGAEVEGAGAPPMAEAAVAPEGQRK